MSFHVYQVTGYTLSLPFAFFTFGRLERLILSDNLFQDIIQKPIDALPLNIRHLSLNCVDLKTWSSIDALPSWLPKLEVLNVASNPLFQGTFFRPISTLELLPCLSLESSSRSLTIAKISTLATLNSSQV